MSTSIIVTRDGETTLRLPAHLITEQADGTLWCQDNPIFCTQDPTEKDMLRELAKAKKFAEIPARYFLKYGDNPEGVWVGTDEERKTRPDYIAYQERQRLKYEAWEREQEKTVKIYLSSRGWGDYSGVEWCGDITRPETEILTECRERLKNAYDVDNPDQEDSEILERIHKAQKVYADKLRSRDQEENARRKLEQELERDRSTATMTTDLEADEDGGGATKIAHHTVTLKSGESFHFSDRNIFDFGRVINPCYDIAPGKTGGVRDGNNWMTFDNGKGWVAVRKMTPEEIRAYDYVVKFGYYSRSSIRM